MDEQNDGADEMWQRALNGAQAGRHGDARIYAIWAGGQACTDGLGRVPPAVDQDRPEVSVLVTAWLEGWDLDHRRALKIAALPPSNPPAAPVVRLPYADDY